MNKPNTLADTRLALMTLLQAVPAVGHVHARERYNNSDSGFKALYLYTHSDPSADDFADASHIRGWYLRRNATAESNTNGRVLNEHTWLIRGFMSFKDEIASELIFDDLVERIRAAVRGSDGALMTAGTLGQGVMQTRGVQVASVGPVMFAGVICHSAALEFTTRNWVAHNPYKT